VVVGQATAWLGLTPLGPAHVFQLASEDAVKFVAYSALPVLSLTTQSVLDGMHETARMLLGLSIVCVKCPSSSTGFVVAEFAGVLPPLFLAVTFARSV
jgi:hypothetical protein